MVHERCAACGFDGSHYSDEELLAAIRDLGPSWKALLGEAGSVPRRLLNKRHSSSSQPWSW